MNKLTREYLDENFMNDFIALAEKGVKVYKTFVGEYMTSIEMEGFSISLLKLDDEMKQLRLGYLHLLIAYLMPAS